MFTTLQHYCHRRHVVTVYLLFMFAFPLGMVWVELRPPGGVTICLFRRATGLDCPSCGMTRAFRAMGRLDVRQATRYNPLGPAVFLGALAFWGYATAMVLTGGRVRLPAWWMRWQPKVLWAFLVVFLVMGFARIVSEIHHPPPPQRPHIALPDFWRK